jgi:AmiR/NasT family two-component response regulator
MLLFLKQTTEMKPYCILKGKPDIVLMDIQMPNKMDMKQRERFAYCLWVPNPIVALTAGIMIDEKREMSQE